MFLPLFQFDVDNYLSYDNVTQVCNNILMNQGSLVDNVIVGAKILGIAFVLLYWIVQYAKGIDRNQGDKMSGITTHKIIVGVLYILLIASYNHVFDLLDRGLGAYEASIGVEVSDSMYQAMDEDWIAEDQKNALEEAESESSSTWDATVSMAKDLGKIVTNMGDLWWWCLQLLKVVAWCVNIMVLPIFLLERGFLLLLMKIAFPLVLALGANEIYRDLVKKWILLYCAVFITGLFFILATQFCDEVYRTLINAGNMSEDSYAKLIIFAVVVFAKVKLYKGAIEISYKIFNS